jgi:hypothetical protein
MIRKKSGINQKLRESQGNVREFVRSGKIFFTIRTSYLVNDGLHSRFSHVSNACIKLVLIVFSSLIENLCGKVSEFTLCEKWQPCLRT